MRKARFTEEQLVAIIREADREPVPAVAKRHSISEQTIYTAGRTSSTGSVARRVHGHHVVFPYVGSSRFRRVLDSGKGSERGARQPADARIFAEALLGSCNSYEKRDPTLDRHTDKESDPDAS